MAKRLCVLFAGTAGAGKDAAANMLSKALVARGHSTLRMAFADPIKDVAFHLLGIPKEVSYGTQKDKADYVVYNRSARSWLQWIGTELARDQIHKDIWVTRFSEKALSSDATVVIGSDCRFRNEMKLMKSLLGQTMDLKIIKIINPRVLVNTAHLSESEIFSTPNHEFDLVIENNTGLEELESSIINLSDKLIRSMT